MTLNTSGALLEGVRISSGNSGFTFPPKSVVLDSTTFDAQTTRAEYLVEMFHTNKTVNGTDIGDPGLRVRWSRNESTVIRFDYDNFGRRWKTCPGIPVDVLGVISNTTRLKVATIDPSVSSAPFSVFVGYPSRMLTFAISFVNEPSDFTVLSSGYAQIARSTGEINFSDIDVNGQTYAGQIVYATRQSFADRLKNNGTIGQVPESLASDGLLFLNPIPGTTQIPIVRIGYALPLIPVEVASDADLGTPFAGSFNWSAETGRIRLSSIDIAGFAGSSVYYDGVMVGSTSFTRTVPTLVTGPYPGVAFNDPSMVGNLDTSRYAFFSTVAGVRYYFVAKIFNGVPSSPPNGSVYINSLTGDIYMSSSDASNFISSFEYVDTVVAIDRGVGMQFYRSGINTSGASAGDDFAIKYQVTDQILTDNLMQVPFVMLPTVPIEDNSLVYSVSQGSGSSGTFTGVLVDSGRSNSLGYGRTLDLDNKKISFSNRKTSSLTLVKELSQIKLDDPLIVDEQFLVTKNGNSITPGIDFDFDSTTGLLEFIAPVGENDLRNKLGVTGTFTIPSKFTSTNALFDESYVGAFILVRTGPNIGVYRIIQINSTKEVTVDGTFASSGSGTIDVRFSPEIIADRFWSPLRTPYKKFSMSRGVSTLDVVPITEFSVLPTTSQVNLSSPAKVGEKFLVSYVSLDSPDGYTVTPTARTEYAAFKIRREQASVVVGTNAVTINPDGLTVSTTRSIDVYVDGVTQDSVVFEAPGTLKLSQTLTTQSVVVDYWVEEAVGGETNFNLSTSPLDLDLPVVSSGVSSSSFNSDLTSTLQPGSAILVDDKEVLIVSTSSYNSVTDQTLVSFESPPTITTDINSTFKSTGPVDGSYRLVETALASTVSRNQNTIVFDGKVLYPSGTVLTITGDPYLVSASKYDAITNKSTILLAVSSKFNYIVPKVTRTIRPVRNPGDSFETSNPAHLGYSLTLVLSGTTRKVLIPGLDYQVSEGGVFKLENPIGSGDVLYAFYVKRVPQAVGTIFGLNYAYGIAPNDLNGLKGQVLNSSYRLSAPDTFFFRVETVQSFIPEVVLELKSSSSAGSSGPNTGNTSSLKTKDYGSPSLFFDEQHLGNVDVVLSRLLAFYNDIANQLEDVLSSYDGRIVGGTSGGFRFDSSLSNPPRVNYQDITNDIDDKIKLYSNVVLTSFFNFSEVPVYGYMWQPTILSRLFPVQKKVTIPLNGDVGPSNFGKVLGTVGLEKLTSVGVMTSSRASARFFSNRTGSVLVVQQNGDPDLLVPMFANGMAVNLYSDDGVLSLSTTVSSVVGTGPFYISLADPTILPFGTVCQDASITTNSNNRFYVPGRDVTVNQENGQVLNNSFPPPLNASQATVVGNELVEATVGFQNLESSPRRIPALDGSTLTDDGQFSVPDLRKMNELSLFEEERDIISKFSFGDADTSLVKTPITTMVGDSIEFFEGPNVGIKLKVTGVIFSGFRFNATLENPLPNVTSDYGLIRYFPNDRAFSSIVSDEISLLANVQLDAIGRYLTSLGSTLVSGIGLTDADTLTDSLVNFFNAGVDNSCYIIVTSGPNIGLYPILDVSADHIDVDISGTNPSFDGNSVSYSIIKPWAFLDKSALTIPNPIIRSSKLWAASTSNWLSNFPSISVSDRTDAITAREAEISGHVDTLEGFLSRDGKIYDNRYIWISSRTDRKNGTLVKKMQASTRREESTKKLLEDQQKLFNLQKLM